jgi:hypothetical protein
VLKKTGIIVAAAATGVLALSGLAFAHPAPHHDAPASVTNMESGNVGNDCDFDQAGSQVAQDLTSGSSLLAAAGPVTGAVIPADVQTQAGNCTNLSVTDVADLDSNNVERTYTRTETVNSGNVED